MILFLFYYNKTHTLTFITLFWRGHSDRPLPLIPILTHHNRFYVYSSVTLSTLTLSYSHHLHLSPDSFCLVKTKTLYPSNISSPFFSLLPKPLETPILLSLCVNVTTPGTSDKWNYTIFVLLHLVYFLPSLSP
jgi:hypothetical protein